MAKKTKKQLLAKQAHKKAVRFRISTTCKAVTTFSVSQASALDPLQPSPDPFAAIPGPVQPSLDLSKPFSVPLQVNSLGTAQSINKTNLLLRDSKSGAPLCMRILPTSLHMQRLASKSAEKGHDLFQKLKATIPSRDIRGLFELGIYHSVGESYLGFTKDTKAEKTRKEASELLKWARDHSRRHLLSLNTLLPPEWKHDMKTPEWKHDMKTREENKFLEKFFGRQAKLLSPWWTTVTFFDAFTGGKHTDDSDHQPSFLFNFGAPCILVLHNYNVEVQLDHLDVAIFDTHNLEHSTKEAGDSGMERWAFSGFYRESIYLEKGPSQLGKKFLDNIFGQVEVETRVRGANK